MTNRNRLNINWRGLARRHPSAFLLAAQFLSLILYATIDEHPSGRPLLSALGILILALVFWVINRSPSNRRVAWILIVPSFVLTLLSTFFVNPTIVVLSSLLDATLYFYATSSLIAYMMKDDHVTIDELFAAGATFTLLAWGFAYLFLVCQIWFPGSFMGGPDPGETRTFLELLFLSFTNLSATGITDILPVTPSARVLMMIEQFAGIAYIAVVVSRLIGMTIVREEKKRKS